jgi:two-component system chemotaxis response regulator CheB
MTSPIKVLIVDDSAVVRRILHQILSADPSIEVLGAAANPIEAREYILRQKPDVITLDLEMPKMDGLTFLRYVMKELPMRVVVMSSLTTAGSRYALEALRLGAVDVLAKPATSDQLLRLGRDLIERVHAAAQARLFDRATTPHLASPPPRIQHSGEAPDPRQLILLGSSTGGIEALRAIIPYLPSNMPPIAIVQHIPAGFSRTFADRLNADSTLEVREATDDIKLRPGMVVIAPGGHHLTLRKSPGGWVTKLDDSPPVWHQRPAVDVLFRSVARTGNLPHVLAGVLTGMGHDGADGLLALRQAGAQTFAQDEATSVVYGMPRVAFEQGGAQIQLPLPKIASHIASVLLRNSLRCADSR